MAVNLFPKVSFSSLNFYSMSLVMLSEQPSSCRFGVLFTLSGDAEFDLLFEFSVDLPILSCLYVVKICCFCNCYTSCYIVTLFLVWIYSWQLWLWRDESQHMYNQLLLFFCTIRCTNFCRFLTILFLFLLLFYSITRFFNKRMLILVFVLCVINNLFFNFMFL